MFLLIDPCFALGVLEGTRAASGAPLAVTGTNESSEATERRLALVALSEDQPRSESDRPSAGDRSFGLQTSVLDAAERWPASG
ncbi:MAG TPA: hypothetical protein VFS20_14355 [Longimicrobium sp.]|nr:hypothetical protein [Longimicrobium sp.]